ncbi:thiol-activated cytolysin family protein [Mucilaginibacter sp.]|uniref:thiol-activated cytolysin family protein n=1 Tax=Mucilaginibacter sp. TaxID=1882438 RepID=UPI003B00A850
MTRNCICILTLLIFSSLLFCACNGSDTKATAKKIDSLIVNEPKLSVQPTDDIITGSSVETIEDPEHHGTKTTERHKLTSQFEKIVAFDPNVGSLYPGALVQGKGLIDGILIPVKTSRNPLTITISDFYQKGNFSVSRIVKEPNKANVNDSIQKILKQETNSAMGADITYSLRQVYSMDQAFLKFNASYKWATGAINGALSVSQNETYSKFLVRLVEKYFTVSCEEPHYPTSYIKEDGYKDLLNYIDSNSHNTTPNPLCYVSSVSYGRELWVLIESKESASDVEASLNASFGGLNTGGKVEMSDETKKILNEAFIQSYIIGGSRYKATDYLGGDKITGLTNFIKAKDTFDILNDPPRPISYTVAYLSDNSPARVSSTTDYTVNTENIKITSPLLSATVHFGNGDDGKDQSTGLRVYLFDNRTLGVNYIAALNKANPDIAPVAYADLYDNTDQGQAFPDNSSIDFPLGLRGATDNEKLQDGVIFIWMFPHGHDRWQFTPTLHLKFKDPKVNRDIPLASADINQSNGYIAIPFTLRR